MAFQSPHENVEARPLRAQLPLPHISFPLSLTGTRSEGKSESQGTKQDKKLAVSSMQCPKPKRRLYLLKHDVCFPTYSLKFQ